MSFRLAQLLLALATVWPYGGVAAAKIKPVLLDGLAVTFKSQNGGQADTTVRPHFMLYVPLGQAPTPFVAPGAFTAEWEGVIQLDLRDRFVFQAELNGSFKLELNGAVVLEATSDGGTTDPTRRIRLNSRSNTLKATYTSPPGGDAFFRLYWASPDFANEPIPPKFLKHSPSDRLAKGASLRHGRQLAAEHRCFACHATGVPARRMLELAMDAPALDGIGSRRDAGWMAEWILNPAQLRPQATMPALLHGATAEAKAIAAFLGSLKSGDNSLGEKVDEPSAEVGQKLFTQLNCAACHTNAGQPPAEGKVALGQARWKFGQADSLATFLRNPQAHYRWNRMPNFALTPDEAAALAAHLFQSADLGKRENIAANATSIAMGRKLVQSTGCLNCHALKLENHFSAPAIADLANGCLADNPDVAKSPAFVFSESDRAALRLFLREGRASLGQVSLAEFAMRQSADANCANCHGQVALIPSFNVLGGKLKPEWAGRILSGSIAERPRPWLTARMPAFPARADDLAKGLALLNGHPPVTPPDKPIDAGKAGIGGKLVSANGGFFCFSCHGIGDLKPAQVFDARGVNLAGIGERLLPEYFRRWMRNPLRIDPQTKMPAYFNQGQSALFDVLDGDAEQQIEALYHYILQGNTMNPPEVPGQ
ncbi:MAG: c-type cytochrome [Verrucomicrobiota bacterium]|nr:c-type cytochrome [Verrucomicrobiota bacterium]